MTEFKVGDKVRVTYQSDYSMPELGLIGVVKEVLESGAEVCFDEDSFNILMLDHEIELVEDEPSDEIKDLRAKLDECTNTLNRIEEHCLSLESTCNELRQHVDALRKDTNYLIEENLINSRSLSRRKRLHLHILRFLTLLF